MGRVAVAVITVLPLLPSLRAAFVYDDTTVIRDNAMLRGWDALAKVWTSPYWPSDGPQSLGLYRPLQLALLSAVWNIGQGSARSFHVYALCLAIGVSFSLWWLLRRGSDVAPALIAAIWFAAHPLHVEAIASVANTSELLVMLATLGMIRLLWHSTSGDGWLRAIGLALLAAAALAAKESGLFALPVAAITVWGWNRRSAREDIRAFTVNRLRYWVAAAVGIAAVIAARLVVLGTPVANGSIAAQGLDKLGAGERVLAMMSLWPRIVAMVVWPFHLAPYYGPTSFPDNRIAFALIGALLLALFAAVATHASRRGDRRPTVALAWIVLTYLPASNVLAATGQILSDRTLFGVTAGGALLLAWALDIAPQRYQRMARLAFVLVLGHNLIVGTQYAIAWTSHRTLWQRLAEVSPNEHMSYKLLGMDARGRGDNEHAIAYLNRALSMVPTDRQIRFELGQAQYAIGEFAPAVVTLAPLLRDTDVRSEPQFVALYLDATGRAYGAAAVADAARRLLHTEADSVATRFLRAAEAQLQRKP